jgi:2-(1,2-epoxy-1,2-dihydrophenyl)acetyl-CoA isomerase
MESILFSKENGIATITLNRPDKFNSVTKEIALGMQQFLKESAEDAEIRCVVITAKGKAFCAGQDLAEATHPDSPDLSVFVKEHYNPIIKKIREIEKPVVAAVNGIAAGAGANIALACDIVIATESAYFMQAFSKIGLIPDSGGTFTLPRLIGMARATALAFLGEKVPAREAVEMGMIYKYVADEDFENEVQKLAEKLAKMPTRGLAYTKLAFNKSLTNDLDTQLAVEEHLQSDAANTVDYKEGVAAFLGKRKPIFQGK